MTTLDTGAGTAPIVNTTGNDSAAVSKFLPDRRGRSLPDQVCEECGSVFTPNSRGTRFCRPYCRYKHRDRLRGPAEARARVRRYYAETGRWYWRRRRSVVVIRVSGFASAENRLGRRSLRISGRVVRRRWCGEGSGSGWRDGTGASRHVQERGLAHADSGDLDEQVAQPDAKRLEFRRETIVVYVGPLQLLGYLVACPEQEDQCWDESACGGDVDSFFGAASSVESRRESR
jgi:hypothetical protein